MSLAEWYYLPIAALINSFFQLYWLKTLKGVSVKNYQTIFLIFFGSFLSSWGIDVIQRVYEIYSYIHVLKVSLGCWLLFAAATSAKHYALNGWSKKSFWIDYGGDLISFFLMGSVIYALT